MDITTDNIVSENVKCLFNKVNIPSSEDVAYNHLVKADALRIKKHFWESIDEYLTALKYNKNNIDAFIGLGLSYKQVGSIAKAIAAFNSAKKINPFEKNTYYKIASCCCMNNEYRKAISYYKKAIKICPEFLEAHFNLAFAYELNKQYTLAIKEYELTISKFPKYMAAYNNLGSLYIKLDKFNKAIKQFKILLSISPEYSRAILGVAISFDKLNNVNSSLRYYKKYIKLKPNCANLPFILERITELQNEKTPRTKSHIKLVS